MTNKLVAKNYPVVVGLSGGLGNQMFQYAAGRSLALRLDVPLALDLTWFGGQQERQFALSPFRIQAVQHSRFSWLPPRVQAAMSRISRRFSPRILGVPVLREPHFQYTSTFSGLSSSVYLEGYWQSERYFDDIRSQLMQDFNLCIPLPPSCEDFLAEIASSNSICVHVRRGDYLSNQEAAKVHGTCSPAYYEAGMAELCQVLEKPRCFIFSDDPAWVRTSLTFDCPTTVVDVNGPSNAHFDLALMAACRHFLIANSSLSWWGAWLSNYSEKRVIAPARWFLTSKKDTADLIPASWQRR